MADSECPSILQLAESIMEKNKRDHAVPAVLEFSTPSYSPTAVDVPKTAEYQDLSRDRRSNLGDLQRLVEGPEKFYSQYLMHGYDISAFQVALDFNFFNLIPLDGDLSLSVRVGEQGWT
ncbi:hypothetical protein GGS21DRAFT_147694 [Xylaria nigripes]|nr:hypothetical protein GGS21DRAFT_147694 [Xylaria nigripes]